MAANTDIVWSVDRIISEKGGGGRRRHGIEPVGEDLPTYSMMQSPS